MLGNSLTFVALVILFGKKLARKPDALIKQQSEEYWYVKESEKQNKLLIFDISNGNQSIKSYGYSWLGIVNVPCLCFNFHNVFLQHFVKIYCWCARVLKWFS